MCLERRVNVIVLGERGDGGGGEEKEGGGGGGWGGGGEENSLPGHVKVQT